MQQGTHQKQLCRYDMKGLPNTAVSFKRGHVLLLCVHVYAVAFVLRVVVMVVGCYVLALKEGSVRLLCCTFACIYHYLRERRVVQSGVVRVASMLTVQRASRPCFCLSLVCCSEQCGCLSWFQLQHARSMYHFSLVGHLHGTKGCQNQLLVFSVARAFGLYCGPCSLCPCYPAAGAQGSLAVLERCAWSFATVAQRQHSQPLHKSMRSSLVL